MPCSWSRRAFVPSAGAPGRGHRPSAPARRGSCWRCGGLPRAELFRERAAACDVQGRLGRGRRDRAQPGRARCGSAWPASSAPARVPSRCRAAPGLGLLAVAEEPRQTGKRPQGERLQPLSPPAPRASGRADAVAPLAEVPLQCTSIVERRGDPQRRLVVPAPPRRGRTPRAGCRARASSTSSASDAVAPISTVRLCERGVVGARARSRSPLGRLRRRAARAAYSRTVSSIAKRRRPAEHARRSRLWSTSASMPSSVAPQTASAASSGAAAREDARGARACAARRRSSRS